MTTVASVIGRSAVRWTAKLWSVEKGLTLAILANAVPLMLMPTTFSYLPLAAMMAVFGVSNGFLGVVTVVHTADTVSAPEGGLAFGIRTTLMRFGSFTGQLAFGTFAENTSVSLSFFGMGLIGIVAAVMLLRLAGRESLAAKKTNVKIE